VGGEVIAKSFKKVFGKGSSKGREAMRNLANSPAAGKGEAERMVPLWVGFGTGGVWYIASGGGSFGRVAITTA